MFYFTHLKTLFGEVHRHHSIAPGIHDIQKVKTLRFVI